MLSLHGYPKLKAYDHFFGHFGTAWQNQTKEFPDFPGPILMTTNCLQRPGKTYQDHLFTSGMVGWPDIPHIPDTDFQPVIDRALALPGFEKDAYSAIQIALALSRALDTNVNDLPLSMILSWYEQKAVSILLALLYLGIRDIRLGPSLPAFFTPTVLNLLVEKFTIMPIKTPDQDIKEILG